MFLKQNLLLFRLSLMLPLILTILTRTRNLLWILLKLMRLVTLLIQMQVVIHRFPQTHLSLTPSKIPLVEILTNQLDLCLFPLSFLFQLLSLKLLTFLLSFV